MLEIGRRFLCSRHSGQATRIRCCWQFSCQRKTKRGRICRKRSLRVVGVDDGLDKRVLVVLMLPTIVMESAHNCLTIPLGLSIGLWMVSRGCHLHCSQRGECSINNLSRELWPVIQQQFLYIMRDDPVIYEKSWQNLLLSSS